MIVQATGRQQLEPILFCDASEIRPQSRAHFRWDLRPSLFRRKDDVHEIANVGVCHSAVPCGTAYSNFPPPATEVAGYWHGVAEGPPDISLGGNRIELEEGGSRREQGRSRGGWKVRQ